MKIKNPLIVALDVDTFKEAVTLIDTLSEVVDMFKVGSQLFTACGPVVIRYILSKDKEVFLDLKFHDIPNTVGNAVGAMVRLSEAVRETAVDDKEQLDKSKSVFMCTVHTVGGRSMLQRAAEVCAQTAEIIGVRRPLIVGITVLTSEEKVGSIQKIVLQRANLARESGLDGVVASSQEASIIRQEFGDDFIIVTPGIRPSGVDAGDQKRITTPSDAIFNGSNFLVVGRPIVKASDPLKSMKQIFEEIRQAV